MYELRASDLSLVGSWTIPVAQQTSDADFGATPTLFNGVIGGQSVSLVGAIDKNGVFYAFKRDALSSGPVWQTRIANGGADPTTGNGPIGVRRRSTARRCTSAVTTPAAVPAR